MKDHYKSNPNEPMVELIRLTPDDLGLCPQNVIHHGKPAALGNTWFWGFIPNKDSSVPPIHYLREFSPTEYANNNAVIRLAENPLIKHTGLQHSLEMHTPGPVDMPYHQVDGDPTGLTNDEVTYEIGTDNPYSYYHFSTTHATMKEADYMEATYEYVPFMIKINSNGPLGVPYFHQHAFISGIYENKPFKGVGAWDRTFGETWGTDIFSPGQLFNVISFLGRCPDGRREWGIIYQLDRGEGMKAVGVYCKDGEEPVLTESVKFEAEWEPLPFADDTTMIYQKATVSFGGKVLHYKAKWGWRGQSYIPWTNPGLSQSSGDWYFGDEPYEHIEGFIYVENHNALKEKLIEEGMI